MRRAKMKQGQLLALSLIGAVAADTCPQVLSCSKAAKTSDPCCVPSPGGLIVFRQRFEPDVGSDLGSWGIDGVDVLDCETQLPVKVSPFSRAYSHEEIGSFCHKSSIWTGEDSYDKAEEDWAQSEVGEGVEELWERSWSTSGRYISTLDPSCMSQKNEPRGSEVPFFFHTLQTLHQEFPIAQMLADADITPSSDTTYSLAEISAALAVKDHRPIVTCRESTLVSVSWPLNAKGKFQDGVFASSYAWTQKTNCPAEGITYPLSTTINPPAPTQTWDPIRRPALRPITKSHDESRMYYAQDDGTPAANRQDPLNLKFFKGSDESRDQKPDQPDKKFHRDEL